MRYNVEDIISIRKWICRKYGETLYRQILQEIASKNNCSIQIAELLFMSREFK